MTLSLVFHHTYQLNTTTFELYERNNHSKQSQECLKSLAATSFQGELKDSKNREVSRRLSLVFTHQLKTQTLTHT